MRLSQLGHLVRTLGPENPEAIAFATRRTGLAASGDAERGGSQGTPLDAVRFVVIDTESTAFDPRVGEVIELGATEVVESVWRREARFSILVRPRHPIPGPVSALTGIRDEDVARAPEPPQAAHALLQFIDGGVVVGHGVARDLRFVRAALGRRRSRFGRLALDTVDIARWLHPYLPDYGLDRLLAFYGIHPQGRHRALGDACLTAQLWEGFLRGAFKRGCMTLEQLMGEVALSS